MYNESQLYELSFVSSGRRPRTKPQIVFAVREEHLEELNNRLHKLVENVDTAAYIGYDTLFSFLVPDLFSHTEFGFGKCGFIVREDGNVRLCVELEGNMRLYYAALTIHLLTEASLVPIEYGYRSNRLQQIDLETRCDRHVSEYGHAIGGYVSARVISWLKAQGAQAEGNNMYVPVPAAVKKAMQDAWHAVTAEELSRWASECRGFISRDGTFILECMGNACDVAIYPDEFLDNGRSVRFGCHNLDSASQQVTLIAGLAKLCELAREDE